MQLNLSAKYLGRIFGTLIHDIAGLLIVLAKRAMRMSSVYPLFDQKTLADPGFATRMEIRVAPRSDSRRSASVTILVAIPLRLTSGRTTSR